MRLNPLPAIRDGCLTFVGWIHVAVCALTTEDGRKGWAMLAALGCSFVMTAIVVAVLWLVRNNPGYSFAIGLAAMGVIVIVITGLMWLLGVRRDTEIDLTNGRIKTSDAALAQAVAPKVEAPQ
jgi:uncharacterized membrane protein